MLSGGSGTRLWPLSVATRPKQFLDIFGARSLFEATLDRAGALPGSVGVTVVTGNSHADLVRAALASSAGERTMIAEPQPKNTAPAIVAAALLADPDDVLVVLPSDHLIADSGAFATATTTAIALAESGGVVAFGCVPDRPEVGYGWIRPGAGLDGGFEIAEFVEKPNPARAKQMLAGGYLWNSGMFVATAATILAEVEGTTLARAVTQAVNERQGDVLSEAFGDSPAISFDHMVMERTKRGVVVPLDAGWSDIGSWHAVWEASDKDGAGNVLTGEVATIDVRNSLVRATTRKVAVVGLDDIVVIETEDGVLVIPRDRAQEVREVQERFEVIEPRP